jgi:oligopeptidase A
MTESNFKQDCLPLFNSVDPARIPTQMGELLEKNRQTLNTLLNQAGPYTWENLMQPLEEMGDELSKAWSPISHLHAVKETEALRKSYNEILPILTQYQTDLAQNEKLFNAISQIAQSPNFSNLDAAQRKIIDNELRDFKLSGIHLSADKKARMAELQKQLSLLMTKFSENVLDATQHWVLHLSDVKQLTGLPLHAQQLAADNAKQRGLKGYALTLDYASYAASLQFLKDRELRKQLYEAHVTRASAEGPHAGKWDNSQVMADILNVRLEIAQLAGFVNYAEYSIATKMAPSTQAVLDFLLDLVTRSKAMAEKEYQEVAAFAHKLDGLPQLEVWDLPYYAEKLRESQFHFSPEDLRPYFPINTVLNGLFNIVQRLYGITVQHEPNIEVWDPHVQFFSIYDKQHNLRGGLYIDLYARPHKREGAWMDECRQRRRIHGNHLQRPVAYLTCNFMPPVAEQSALLTHDDVLTLFHEFGHCLHHLLTKVDFPSVAGINGVAWDAVEFPSQFMENFCWEKESLALITAHYQTGALLPDELYQKMLNAKNFHAGIQMLRQLEFSLFDFRMHMSTEPIQPQQIQFILDETRKEVAVVHPPAFNRFQNSFAHVFAGSYAAGYYSYKWAEVLSADAYAKFQENGILDAATGQSFMENILEVGGVRDPMVSFIAFRERAPTIDALLQQSGIK